MKELDKKRMLAEPFKPSEVEWRLQASGKTSDGSLWALAIPYLNSRDIMSRLDEVFGIGGWKNEYTSVPEGVVQNAGGVICELSVKFEDGWITKKDIGTTTEIEPLKGAISGSLKRAAVLWGIGRYMYEIEPIFVKTSTSQTQGWNKGKTKDGQFFYWETPGLPTQYLPQAQITINSAMVIENLLLSLAELGEAQREKYTSFFGVDTIGCLYEAEAKKVIVSLEKMVMEKDASPKPVKATKKNKDVEKKEAA